MKEKKRINSNYGILVILLFATVAFLTDYIIIERKLRVCECPKCETTNNEVISDNTDNTQVTENQTYSYEDIGLTNFTIDFNADKISAEIIDGNIVLVFSSPETYLSYRDNSTVFSGTETITLNTGNAKKMYYITYHQGGVYRLFFISDDNKLYELSEDIYTLFGEKKLSENYPTNIYPKILSDDAVQFIEYKMYNGKELDSYSLYPYYISILDSKGNPKKVFFNQTYLYGPYNDNFAQ